MLGYDILILLGVIYFIINSYLAWDDLLRAGVDIWKGIQKSFPFLVASLIFFLFGLPLILIEWCIIRHKGETPGKQK